MPNPVKIGYLAANGHPHIKIKIWGIAKDFAQEFEAMIDTGFTGFLSIPLTAAFPLALTLFGTGNYELADGTVSPKLLGWGTIELDDETANGIIVLESKSTGLIVGMQFLKNLNKALFLSKDGVWLVDEGAIAASAQNVTTPVAQTEESSGPKPGPAVEEKTGGEKTDENPPA
jgi:predicted aspartyl protease